jgi:TBC domain-containing protein kinase-like protein
MSHVFSNNDALVLEALREFLNIYLKGMFLKSEPNWILEQLCLIRKLLAFHDPLLASHLEKIGVDANLYAVPWILTAFSR